MSRREDFDNAFWDDPDVELLSADATLLYIWSWTNRRCGMSGVYKASRRALTESKVPADRLDAALAELEDRDFLYYQDDVVFVRARVKRLRQKTTQIAKAIENDLKVLPDDHPIRVRFLSRYGHYAWISAEIARLSRGSTETPLDSQFKGPSVEAQSSLPGNGNGTGTGKNPKRTADAGAREAWTIFAAEHLPDFPEDFVVVACSALSASGLPVTPDAVRGRLLRQYPDLAEAAA